MPPLLLLIAFWNYSKNLFVRVSYELARKYSIVSFFLFLLFFRFILEWIFCICPQYGLSRKPLTHFGKISLDRVPSWYVPFLQFTIQIGPIHLYRSFPSIAAILVWKTSTGFPIPNCDSVFRQCRFTNALVCLCLCSKAVIACSWSSSNSKKDSFRICSNCSSFNFSVACIGSVGI